MKSKIRDDYYYWLVDLTCSWCSRYGGGNYSNLMDYLYARQFTWVIPHDKNRASDGFEMRYRFVEQSSEYTYRDVYLYLTSPCNVLEMMAALASRCEEHIMGDPSIGDNTGCWFWEMIANMHLDQCTNDYFDENYVEATISNMLEHRYQRNGDGGLFRVNDPTKDMRSVEIWCQLCWYLKDYV